VELLEVLQRQEGLRNAYWEKRDRYLDSRLRIQAHMVRHLFHLLPGESILELAAGAGRWTEELCRMTSGENPICSVTLDPEIERAFPNGDPPRNLEIVRTNAFPGELQGRQFDYVVGWHSLANESFGPFLLEVQRLLKPGGQFLFLDSNPWNPFYRCKVRLARCFRLREAQRKYLSVNRLDTYRFLSEVGLVRVILFGHDFVYPWVPRFVTGTLHALNPILENAPLLKNFARSVAIFGQKPSPPGWRRELRDLARHDSLRGKVSVVIPCHNEATNIPALVEGLVECYGGYLHEILIVDDNSTDDTAQVTEELANAHPVLRLFRRSMPNGVGRALRDGIAEADGEYVLLMDGDFQLLLPEFSGLFDAVADGADMAVGSRFSPGSVLINYPFMKILANRFFHFVARVIFWKRFRDVTNNLKLMRSDIAKQLDIESHDFAANAETGLKPILRGYDVREAPISWINRSVEMGLSNFSLGRSGPNYAGLLARLWRTERRGAGHTRETPAGESNGPEA